VQKKPGPPLNPERRQRGNCLHHQPLRRVVDVMRRGGWGMVTGHVQEMLLIPEFCPGGQRQRRTVNNSTLLV